MWADKKKAEKALGLAGSYSRKDVDSAYRSLVKECHPDLGGDQDRMIEVNWAKEVMDRLFRNEPIDAVFACEAEKTTTPKTESHKSTEESAKPYERRTTARARATYETTKTPEEVAAEEEARAAAREARRRRADERIRAAEEADFNRAEDDFFSEWGYSADKNRATEPVEDVRRERAVENNVSSSPVVSVNRFCSFMSESFPWRVIYAATCILFIMWNCFDAFTADTTMAWMLFFASVTLAADLFTGVISAVIKAPFTIVAKATEGLE